MRNIVSISFGNCSNSVTYALKQSVD